MSSQNIKFYLHGKEHTVDPTKLSPETSLNEYLRSYLNLTGTKKMCLEGGCGACIAVVRKKDPVTNEEKVFAVNSCLVSILTCHGWKIETIEGIGGPLTQYHPVQTALANFNGTQCGYCSSGMVMNMYGLFEAGKLTMKEVENSFGGNICRCTGYRPILSAFKSLCKDASEDLLGKYTDIEDLKLCRSKCDGWVCVECPRRDGPLEIVMDDAKWIKVYDLKDLLSVLTPLTNSIYKLVAGNTGKGVFKTEGPFDTYIDITEVKELHSYELTEDKLALGGSMSLTDTMELFYDISTKNTKFAYLSKLGDHIDLIANVPVRNTGTLAGNLMMKHDHHDFPSDIFLTLTTVGTVLTIASCDGTQITKSMEEFLTFDMKQKVLQTITLPSYTAEYKYESYKIMPRAQNAHAIVNAGFLFKFGANDTVDSATIIYGNINPDFVHASKTENFLKGKTLFDNDILQQTYAILNEEIVTDFHLPEPSAEFRKALAIALFYKTVLSWAPDDKITPINKSGATKLVRDISSGAQDYETNESLYPLTKAIPKIEALAQTSGQAEYIDDITTHPNQLYASFVLAKAGAGATIEKIDASKALALDGIVAFFKKDDIPGDNNFMPKDLMGFTKIEEVFCSGTVKYYDQPIGMIVGNDPKVARKAAALVEVTYTPPKDKLLITIRDVLKANATARIQEVEKVKAKSKGNDIKEVIKGSFEIGHQYHFHMETQISSAIPTEDGMNVYTSTQWMDLTQIAIARMLNISQHKINITVRRCGGGFGAKISRNTHLACAVALATEKLRKPVKMSLSLSDNMRIYGKRMPFVCDYEVAVNAQGLIQYLTCSMYSDVGVGGNEIALPLTKDLFCKNYVSDTFEFTSYIVLTDTHPNTWARAPGSLEGLSAIEAIMDHISYQLSLDSLQVRVTNMTGNQELQKYVDDIKTWAGIDQRKLDIDKFNKENRWKKKGLSVVPMDYYFMPYGPLIATVSIFHMDGTVSISHGGIEIGQGVNTKAAQACAFKLGIPLEKVQVRPSNSHIAANSVVTGGSITSEGICYAVIDACNKLMERMRPYKKEGMPWEEWVTLSYNNFVCLTTEGQYYPQAPGIQPYQIYGATACEVLIDVLTGQHLVTRVDIIEDTGMTISPEIDIGQVEGAFIMGMGYYTSERIVFDENGQVLTNNTWTYKPPGAKDIPIDFRIKFPKKNENPVGVLMSKATGEPPLCMSVSVPLALKNAIAAARADVDKSQPKWVPFGGPASVEHTFMNSLNSTKQYVL